MDMQAIRDLVANLAQKNMIDAQDAFGDIMSSKMSAALDTRRREVAASIYGRTDDPAAVDPLPSTEESGAEE